LVDCFGWCNRNFVIWSGVTEDGLNGIVEWLVVCDLFNEEEIDIVIQAGEEVYAVAVLSP